MTRQSLAVILGVAAAAIVWSNPAPAMCGGNIFATCAARPNAAGAEAARRKRVGPNNMRIVLRSACAAIMSVLGACNASGPSQNAVSPGDLPAIRPDYRAAILTWARGFYAEAHGLRDTAISDPLLRRDDTGRLVWLVCVEANAPN